MIVIITMISAIPLDLDRDKSWMRMLWPIPKDTSVPLLQCPAIRAPILRQLRLPRGHVSNHVQRAIAIPGASGSLTKTAGVVHRLVWRTDSADRNGRQRNRTNPRSLYSLRSLAEIHRYAHHRGKLVRRDPFREPLVLTRIEKLGRKHACIRRELDGVRLVGNIEKRALAQNEIFVLIHLECHPAQR